MSDFIISPYAISFDSIKNNLTEYIANKTENESWLDFYASSAGQTIVEIAAALGAFYAYHFISGRRESFLSSVQNYTSGIGLAQNLGYSTKRGENLQISVNIVPNETVTLPKWTIIGTYTEYDVMLMEQVSLNKGVATDVPVIIGNCLVETIRVNSNKLQQFSFLNSKVTDTYRLILNQQEVPVSTEIKDALLDKYITISNVYGAIDVFYLQQGNYQYFAKDDLHLQFIERNNLTFTNYSNSNLIIDYASQINETTLIQDRTDIEDLESIKAKAPLYHETAMTIRARKDYSKYLKLKHPQIIEASDMDIYPGLIGITYIKNDGTNLTQEEKQEWLDNIEESRPSGVAKAEIIDSVTVNKTLNISLWKAQGKNIDKNISETINGILEAYEGKFEVDVDLNQIEHEIEQLDCLKIARVDLDYTDRISDELYSLYDTVNIENKHFYASSFIYRTGKTQPTWPTELNETVRDGDIVWKKVDEFQGIGINYWQPEFQTDLYDYIKVEKKGTHINEETGEEEEIILVDIFVCAGFVNTTGTKEPEWDSEYVFDNKIIWQKLQTGITVTETWKPNYVNNIGDLIITNNGVYRCANFRNTTSSNVITLEEDMRNGVILDGNIRWVVLDDSTRSISLGWNEHIKLDKIVTIVG